MGTTTTTISQTVIIELTNENVQMIRIVVSNIQNVHMSLYQ